MVVTHLIHRCEVSACTQIHVADCFAAHGYGDLTIDLNKIVEGNWVAQVTPKHNNLRHGLAQVCWSGRKLFAYDRIRRAIVLTAKQKYGDRGSKNEHCGFHNYLLVD
jgi:hypothetical protein